MILIYQYTSFLLLFIWYIFFPTFIFSHMFSYILGICLITSIFLDYEIEDPIWSFLSFYVCCDYWFICSFIVQFSVSYVSSFFDFFFSHSFFIPLYLFISYTFNTICSETTLDLLKSIFNVIMLKVNIISLFQNSNFWVF